jgi:hypothetical protein
MTCTFILDGLQPLVLQALEQGGFDGLYIPSDHCEDGCACKLDDLMPCDDPSMDCRPGYLQPLTPAECDFVIGPTKHPTPRELEAAGQQTLFDPAAFDNPYPTPIVE